MTIKIIILTVIVSVESKSARNFGSALANYVVLTRLAGNLVLIWRLCYGDFYTPKETFMILLFILGVGYNSIGEKYSILIVSIPKTFFC